VKIFLSSTEAILLEMSRKNLLFKIGCEFNKPDTKMMKKALLLSLCLLLASCGKQEEKPESIRPVRALQLVKEAIVQSRIFPGRTRAVNRSNLSFRVDGPMIERPVFVGDQVSKGQLLARIDPRDYEVNLQIVEGKLEQAEAQLRFAERDYERATNIWKKDPGAISKSLLDQKLETMNELKGQLVSLQGDVKAAEDRVSYTEMTSPFEGIIVATYVEPFEYVNAKQPIMRLLDTSKVEMVIDVPESQIAEIQDVQKIMVSFDSYPEREFEAKIKEIGTEASATTRTFPVTLLIEQPKDATILAGMAGYARLYGRDTPDFSEQGFLVPTTAIISDVDKSVTYVWLIDTGTMKVYLEPVEKGRLTERGVIITGGLNEGEWVVTSGANLLQEGQVVRILPVTLDEQGRQNEVAD